MNELGEEQIFFVIVYIKVDCFKFQELEDNLV